MENGLTCKYEKHKTVQAMWATLIDKFGDTSISKLRKLTIKIDTYKIRKNIPMKPHLRDMSTMIKEHKEAGYKLRDEKQVHVVISMLPSLVGRL